MADPQRDVKCFFHMKEYYHYCYFNVIFGHSNAHQAYSFTKAYVEFPQFSEDLEKTTEMGTKTMFISIGHLFEDAFKAISYDQANGMKIERLLTTSDNSYKLQQSALKRLSDFINDYKNHEKALMLLNDRNMTETKVCGLLAVHLFSKLVCGDVIVAKEMRGQSNECPCGCGGNILIGNTGIGNGKTWHGFPDMLIQQTSFHLKLLKPEDEVSAQSEESEDTPVSAKRAKMDEDPYYSVEVKACETDIYDFELNSLLVSQCVTNGFAQKSKYNLNNYLVPSIACTQDQIRISLYDPDRDIFLERHEAALFRDGSGHLLFDAIVELWLILNLHYFGPTLSDSVVARFTKSGVKTFLESQDALKYYLDPMVAVDSGKLSVSCSDLNSTSTKRKVLFIKSTKYL